MSILQNLENHRASVKIETRKAYAAIIRRAAESQNTPGDEVMLAELVRELNSGTAELTFVEREELTILQEKRATYGLSVEMMTADERTRLAELEGKKVIDPAADIALVAEFFSAQTEANEANKIDFESLKDSLARDTDQHNARVREVNAELARQAHALAGRSEFLHTRREAASTASRRLAEARTSAGDLVE